MLHEELFAVPESDVDRVAERLGTALEVAFEKRRSLYRGDYCLSPPFKARRADYGEIRVYRNFDPMHQGGTAPSEEQFFEPEFQDFGVLVYAYLTVEELAKLRERLRTAFPDAVVVR